MKMKTILAVILILLLSLVFYACSSETVPADTSATTAEAAPSVVETDAAETTATTPAKDLTLADLEGLDGKAALALLEENGLQLGEHYASNKAEAADAVAQILLDLKEGRTDPEMLYSKGTLIELHQVIKEMLGVPDRLQLYDIQNLVMGKGEKLSWADLEKYQYEDVGSGLYIRQYPVGSEDEYVLVVSGKDLSAEPEEMSLFRLGDGALDLETDQHIDIRHEDVDKFLSMAG